MFDDVKMTQRVSTLSGGEQNRLLLAKLFAQSHNFLVLDEPTNDLDIETLELLQEVIADYDGTVLIVSRIAIFWIALSLAFWHLRAMPKLFFMLVGIRIIIDRKKYQRRHVKPKIGHKKKINQIK